MKECPDCHKLGVEYDPFTGRERCLWNDCGYVNSENENLDKRNIKSNFVKFRESIKPKEAIL